MGGGAEGGGQQQPTHGGVLGRDRSGGEKNLIRLNEVLYQLAEVFIIIMLVQTCGVHLMLLHELCFTVLLVKSSPALATICSVLLLQREYKISNSDVRCNIGNGGQGESKEGGGNMDQFAVLASGLDGKRLEKLSECLRRVCGSKEAGGGGSGGDRKDSEAMSIDIDNSGGDGSQGGGGCSGGESRGQGGGRSGGGNGEVESGGGGGSDKNNLGLIEHFSKLSKMSIAVAVQTTGSIISYNYSGKSSLTEILFVSVMICNFLSYLCSLSSILQARKRPWVAGILGGIGSAASALGYILLVALSLPGNLLWIVGLACLALLFVFVMAFV